MVMSSSLMCRYTRLGHLSSAAAIRSYQCAAEVRGARRLSALVDVSCLTQGHLPPALVAPLLRRRSSAFLLALKHMHAREMQRNLGTSSLLNACLYVRLL